MQFYKFDFTSDFFALLDWFLLELNLAAQYINQTEIFLPFHSLPFLSSSILLFGRKSMRFTRPRFCPIVENSIRGFEAISSTLGHSPHQPIESLRFSNFNSNSNITNKSSHSQSGSSLFQLWHQSLLSSLKFNLPSFQLNFTQIKFKVFQY